MDLDLDTFLVAVYCIVDELYGAQVAPPRRPGRAVALSDSEVLTIMALAQSQTHRSERRFVRYVAKHWRADFPPLLSPRALHLPARGPPPALLRVRGAWGPPLPAPLAALWRGAGVLLPPYEVFHGVPMPLLRRCR